MKRPLQPMPDDVAAVLHERGLRAAYDARPERFGQYLGNEKTMLFVADDDRRFRRDTRGTCQCLLKQGTIGEQSVELFRKKGPGQGPQATAGPTGENDRDKPHWRSG